VLPASFLRLRTSVFVAGSSCAERVLRRSEIACQSCFSSTGFGVEGLTSVAICSAVMERRVGVVFIDGAFEQAGNAAVVLL
jgi:hypothetical protein